MSGAPRPGALRWAVRPSFVRYVTQIAAGTCEAVDGAALDEAGTFEFPLLEALRKDDGWLLAFGGGARFSAHGGFLDVQLRGLLLKLTGDGAALGVSAPGGPLTIATMAPAAPVTQDGLVRWLGLVPFLTEAGVQVFGGVYPAGSEFGSLDAVVPAAS